jgi:hypothetical protein
MGYVYFTLLKRTFNTIQIIYIYICIHFVSVKHQIPAPKGQQNERRLSTPFPLQRLPLGPGQLAQQLRYLQHTCDVTAQNPNILTTQE